MPRARGPRHCEKCGQAKELIGQRWQCRECLNAKHRADHAANADAKNAALRAKRAADPEVARAVYRRHSALYRERHPEAAAEYMRERRGDPVYVAADREYRQQNPQVNRKAQRKRAGWAPGEHDKAEARLPHVRACDCCGSTDPRREQGWCADHDHATGLFRGFLCQACNIRLGYAEKHALPLSAIEAAYLARHKQNGPEISLGAG